MKFTDHQILIIHKDIVFHFHRGSKCTILCMHNPYDTLKVIRETSCQAHIFTYSNHKLTVYSFNLNFTLLQQLEAE